MGSFRPGAGNQHLHLQFQYCRDSAQIHYAILRVGTYRRNFAFARILLIMYGRRLLGLKFKLLTSLNGPAPGGVAILHFSGRLLDHFSAATLSTPSPEAGSFLPSSLTILLPSALGFSPHPPVSVLRYGHI